MPYMMNIYVDGGCRRNGQPGAYGSAAACFKLNSGRYSIHTRNLPSSPAPTNQRAEITAVVLALESAKSKFLASNHADLEVTIHSDSRYVVGCMTEWMPQWLQNNWTNSAGYRVANVDLLNRASQLDDELRQWGWVNYTWIPREHNGVADEAVNKAMDGR